MSEGSRRCYHKIGTCGGGEKGVPLSRLVAFCCIREGERIHRRGRGGRGGGRAGIAGDGQPQGLPLREGDGGWGGRMDSCLRRNDGWGARGLGFRRGKRAAPPRSSAALSFEGRFQTCPYHRPAGDDSPRRARGARRGERRDSRGRATTRVAPTGGGTGEGETVAKKGGNVAWCCILLHFRLLLSCRGDSGIAPTGERIGRGKRAAPPRSSAALSFEGRFQTCPYDRP